MGKGEITRCEQFLLFPQCFPKAGTEECHIMGLFGKSYTMKDMNYNIEATGQNNITHTLFTVYYKCFEGMINCCLCLYLIWVRKVSINRSINGTISLNIVPFYFCLYINLRLSYLLSCLSMQFRNTSKRLLAFNWRSAFSPGACWSARIEHTSDKGHGKSFSQVMEDACFLFGVLCNINSISNI